MRYAVVMGAALLAGCATTGTTPAPDAQPLLASAMAETSVPGMAVIEIADGQIGRERVRGLRRAGSSEPVRAGDVWHLGSNAKPIVTTLIAILVERGALRWDMTLAEALPDLAAAMDPALRAATLLDLASHRSGLAENADLAFIESFYGDTRPAQVQRAAYLARALATPPAGVRGEYQYSNTGFIALGAVAETAAGLPLEALLRREIFDPLAMRSAGFGPVGAEGPQAHEAGRPLAGETSDNPAFWTPAGTLHMAMTDWARWALDQLEGERGQGRLLSAAGYRFLHTARFTPPGRKTAVALDWGVRDEPYGRVLTHTGSNGYWYAIVALAPDARKGVLVAANAAEDMGGDKAAAAAFFAVQDRWLAEAQGANPPPPEGR